eukprot:scaffold48791_cov59-Phaeocystis_antarctica.AAC.1
MLIKPYFLSPVTSQNFRFWPAVTVSKTNVLSRRATAAAPLAMLVPSNKVGVFCGGGEAPPAHDFFPGVGLKPSPTGNC